MRIGMVGLGRMGANIVRRLMKHGHGAVVFDRDPKTVTTLAAEGAAGVESLAKLVERLEKPRAVWLMVPAGDATQSAIDALAGLLEKGDIVIDGGNSCWKDDLRRGHALGERGIQLVDAGTSGGVYGLERGYCLMVGGDKASVDRLMPIFTALAPEGGFVHAGPTGAGHFVKMIHNGIEYGMMQAYAEGFDILRNAGAETLAPDERFHLDLAAVAEAWRHGSVITSWLLDLTAEALAKDPALARYAGVVSDSGEGRWALMAAIEERVPAEVLAAALHARFRSQQDHTFAEKILSAQREGFGGHVEPGSRPK